MRERGWNWTASKTRQTQLVEWIVSALPGNGPVAGQNFSVADFYNALPDQSVNIREVAVSDLESLKRAGLVNFQPHFGGIEYIYVQATQRARDQAEAWQSMRADIPARKAACRDALLHWLYANDATSELVKPIVDKLLDDPRRGMFFARPFGLEADVDAAAAWLERQGFIKGIRGVSGRQGPVRAYLLDSGVTCVEDFNSEADKYLAARRQRPGYGPTVNIAGGNSGPLQVAGDNAHQVQNFSSPDELRLVIAGIAEIVRAFAPESDEESRREEAAALAAVSPHGVNEPALRRFRDWAVTALRTGTNNSVVAAVSSTMTFLLLEAGRLALHLAG